MINYEGLGALQHILAYGIKVIGAYESGAAIASGDDYTQAFTADITEIQNLIAGKGDRQGRAKGTPIHRFRFVPKNAGLVCIDIDRGHADGIDGLAEFYRMFERDDVYRPGLPKALQDIEHSSFPVYTSTPSGGFHLYFRYCKTETFKHSSIAPNVEVFHISTCLTAPGSYKAEKPYILHGSFDNIPELYPMLERKLSQQSKKQQPIFSPLPDRQKREVPSLNQLAEWTEQDGVYSGRNELCFQIARRAARATYTYTENEVIAFLQGYYATSGHEQIKSAVYSAFQYQRKI
jgi:hypothetical protein